nr:MAG TPA: hypothetical protein [Bacteriophage sp.]
MTVHLVIPYTSRDLRINDSMVHKCYLFDLCTYSLFSLR